ncbi:UNVERIFIED_CONTAM: protein AGENET DOMAIN (AGD)-CONTAINING P1 [Sesamum calycinum]|uniref:Protein AGENET DOMAIN (AGD)-CONTAINING P1 n=1 Tax=Sesamum calycinum TaxID=2727403 RepID=A0AAW2SBN7_9LAMI
MGGAAKHPQLLKPRSPQISSPHHPHNRRRRSSSSRHHHHFPLGSLVEVRTDEEDFKGVFFSATVLPPPKKCSKKKPEKLYVEYNDLLADEDGSERLREYVDISFVRPPPPFQEIVKCFEPDDVVDAFYKDGWWTGVVTRVLEGGQRFVVTFQYPPDELEFRLAELRVHWDWVNGSWVRPGKQNIAGSMFDIGRNVEVSFDREDCRDAWFPATIQEDLGNGAFVVEYCSEDTGNNVQALKVTIDSLHLRPCPPLLKEKNFDLLEKVDDAFFSFGCGVGVITKELENSRYVVFFKQMKRDKEFYLSELRPHMEWKDGKWFTSSQPLTKLEEGNVLGSSQQITHDRSIEEMSVSVSPVSVNYKASSARQTATGDRSSDHPSWGRRLRRKQRNIDATEKFVEAVNLTSSYDYEPKSQLESLELNVEGKVPDALGNTTPVQNERVKEEAERPVIIGDYESWNDQMQQPNDSTILKMKDSRQLEAVEFSERRKRGRPRKLQIKSMRTSVAENGAVGSDDVYRKDDDPHRVLEVEVMEVTLCSQEKRVFNNDELTIGRSGPKNSFDSSGGKMMEVNCTVEVNKVICESPSNELDDEPLSKWIEGMHSSSFIDGSPSPVSAMVECIENGKKQRDNIALEEDTKLAFCEKHCSLENNRIHGSFPKNTTEATFKPLENFRESSREGLAIGYMVTFSSVVEKTSRLQVSDPKSITDDILETLADLERQGFDVRTVRERVAELLSVKDKQEKLVDEVDKLNNQILEHNREKSRIDEEIGEINEHIGKLQKKLSLAESAKEKEDDEIASLLARLKETEESINKVGRDFEGIAASRL